MVAPYVNPLINFLPINAALDNINDTAVAREKVRATVEAGRRDDSRLDLERQRLAQAAEMNRLEARIKEDALKYLPTQRQLQEEAIRSEIAKRQKETEFIGHKPVDPIDALLLERMKNRGATPAGPPGLIEDKGSSPGGPADGQMPSVPGIVVGPPSNPMTITQLVPPPTPRPQVVQPTQTAPVVRPPQQTNRDDRLFDTPFGRLNAQETQDYEMLLRMKGRTDAADQLKNIREGSRKLRPEDMKQIDEADDQVLSAQGTLNNLKRARFLNQPTQAYDGPAAEERAWLVNNTPIGSLPLVDDKRGIATKEYSTLMKDLALSQLKAVFSANPTEGERKILLEVQGSANDPRDARERILRKAEWFANRRLEYNRQKAAAVRDGSYWLPNGQIKMPPDPTDEELERIINPKADPKNKKPDGPQRAPGAPIGRPTQSRPQQDPAIRPLPKEQRADWPTPNDGHIQALLRNPTPEAKEFFKQKFGPSAVDDILKGRR